MKILVINPGSTSTKIAVFEDLNQIFKKNIIHTMDELNQFQNNNEQIPYRKQMILDALQENGYNIQNMDAFASRGGGQCSHIGGTYKVNELMVKEAYEEKYASHPALLGSQIAYQFMQETGKPAFMVNSPATDEMKQIARITGIKGVYRICYSHALNQKEVALRYAQSINEEYENLNLIICHIGGGVSVTAHEKGKMIDTNDILNGDGPMAPNRVGSIPTIDIIERCYEGYSKNEMMKFVRSQGGLYDHLGTTDAREIVEMIENGNHYAKNVYDAFIYQIAKYIGSMYIAMHCHCDAIILTGGIANDKYVTNQIKDYVESIAPVFIKPGEFEMEALAHGAYDALTKHNAYEYTGIPVWNESMLYNNESL
ncbi:MAG: butyrate kinase [Erysipelotrichaceae bacterium]|nr:butyrate kinase [Erysipelotrichaceae bacterium]